MRKTLFTQGLRILAIAALATLCMGLIVHSARSIHYRVDGVDRTEVAVTELSLTHNVEHAVGGGFTRPYPETDPALDVAKPSKSSGQNTQARELAAKKPAPKKPGPAKPAPKKPSPRKPTPKKPGAGKACPT